MTPLNLLLECDGDPFVDQCVDFFNLSRGHCYTFNFHAQCKSPLFSFNYFSNRFGLKGFAALSCEYMYGALNILNK